MANAKIDVRDDVDETVLQNMMELAAHCERYKHYGKGIPADLMIQQHPVVGGCGHVRKRRCWVCNQCYESAQHLRCPVCHRRYFRDEIWTVVA